MVDTAIKQNVRKDPSFISQLKTGYRKHNEENQLLRNALEDKKITEEQYKRMGGFNVAQNMPNISVGGVKIGSAGDVGLASLGYQGIKKFAGLIDPNDPNAQYGDIGAMRSVGLNYEGAKGLPENDLNLYNQILGKTTARETAATTPTPDSEGYAAYEGIVPGFKAKKRPDGRFEYKAPDGQIYGPDTYTDIAVGKYPNIYDPNPMMEFTGESFANVPISILNLLRTIPASDYNNMGPRRQEVEKIIQERTGKTAADFLSLKSGGRVGLMGGAMPTGIMRSNKAGVMERDYRDEGGFVPVGIKEKADDVPAMLSKNEFVFTADAVRGAGNGSIEKGAQKMYDTMKNLERRVV